MKEFYAPRARLFRKRRIGLRHIVLPVVAATALGLLYVLMPQANAPEVASLQPAYVAPVLHEEPHTDALSRDSIKAALDAVPVAPAYNFAAAQQKSTLSRKIESIQSGITAMLEAGGDMMATSKKVAVAKGDTLMDLLIKNNVPSNEAHEAIVALRKVYDPRNLNVGHEVTVFFHKDPSVADPKFSGLSIERDIVNTVSVNRSENGDYTANEEAKQVHRTVKAYRGNIDSSLYVSAKAQGVPDRVIIDLIKMYSWNVDFQREIQQGDSFEVLYEEFATETGDVVRGKGEVLYAELTLSGKDLPFYRFEDSAGDVGYYDEKGRSAKRPLMKTPIDGARISSGFGMRRHPVLGYSKMHKGMDFAASRGTPIYAAGDGTIVKIGPFSSYGKYIKIRHNSGLETAYAHMNGFKKGLKSGSRVKQGEVIGYVGTTGRSTGPHLHYEVLVSGKQVNPNSLKLPTGKTLAGKDMKAFNGMVASHDRDFEDAVRATLVATTGVPATLETAAR